MGLFGSKKTGKNAKENKKENPLNVPNCGGQDYLSGCL